MALMRLQSICVASRSCGDTVVPDSTTGNAGHADNRDEGHGARVRALHLQGLHAVTIRQALTLPPAPQVMRKMGIEDVALASMHSISKGFTLLPYINS